MSTESGPHTTSQSRPPPNRRRDKIQLSCNLCRKLKRKCDRERPCGLCKTRGFSSSCSFQNVQESQDGVGLPVAQAPSSDTAQQLAQDIEQMVLELHVPAGEAAQMVALLAKIGQLKTLLAQQHTPKQGSNCATDAASDGQNTLSGSNSTIGEAPRTSSNSIRHDKEAGVQWTWCREVDRSFLEQQHTPVQGRDHVADANARSQNTVPDENNTICEASRIQSNGDRHDKEGDVQWTESTYPPFSYLRFREKN